MQVSHEKRGSIDEAAEKIESNMQLAKRGEIEERQLGFLDDLEEAGRSATKFLGGIFNPPPATTAEPVETATVVPQPEPTSSEEVSI